ncbi:MAG: DUF4339 domain-containing protein [Erysipelotrichaceae bacterium]|nr:DUF4339 domain-containing protein [Erysipelotrichaceae bacterium]
MNKIWKIRGKEGKFTDEELIRMIKEGELSYDDYITTNEMKTWLRIRDTIYQFYLKGDK